MPSTGWLLPGIEGKANDDDADNDDDDFRGGDMPGGAKSDCNDPADCIVVAVVLAVDVASVGVEGLGGGVIGGLGGVGGGANKAEKDASDGAGGSEADDPGKASIGASLVAHNGANGDTSVILAFPLRLNRVNFVHVEVIDRIEAVVNKGQSSRCST